MTDFKPTPEQHHVEGRHRSDSDDPGTLFGNVNDAVKNKSFGTNAGLISGDRSDPVLLGGVGYPLLGDLALGTVVAYQLAKEDPDDLAIADFSHTPVAAYQSITEGDYEAVLLVGAEKRDAAYNDGQPSANPGKIHEYAPEDVEIPDDQMTNLVGQGAMGLNTLENAVVITRSLGDFPDDTKIIGVEVGYDSWGMNVDEFTEPVEEALDEVFDRVRELLDLER